MNRRALLATAGGVISIPVAGCLGSETIEDRAKLTDHRMYREAKGTDREEVRTEITVKNITDEEFRLGVVCEFLDADGDILATPARRRSVGAGETHTYDIQYPGENGERWRFGDQARRVADYNPMLLPENYSFFE